MGTTLHPQQLLHTGSTVAMAIFEPGKEEKRERMREGVRERDWGGKELLVLRERGSSAKSRQGNSRFSSAQPAADSFHHG